MNQKIKIEKVNKVNFDDFVQFIEKLAKYERQIPPDNQAKSRLKQDTLGEHPKIDAYLGTINGKTATYVIFFMTYSSYLALPILYIEDIFVLEEWRWKGIGRQMFRFCVQQAKKRGCGRMEWCVYNWNQPAIKFYKKINATQLDKTYYRLNNEQVEHFSD